MYEIGNLSKKIAENSVQNRQNAAFAIAFLGFA